MDKMLFQFTRIGFCDDIHTKQRRALITLTKRDFKYLLLKKTEKQ